MFDYKLVEVTPKTDFNKIDFSVDNNCLVFFHYDKSKIIEDHYFVKKFEEKYKYNINWIDISDLFNNYKDLQNKLKNIPQYNLNINEDQIILNYIKEYVFDQFIRTCKFYKV